jgi:hypothetical protein
MKEYVSTLLFLGASVIAISGAPFQNLGFDSPTRTFQRPFDFARTEDALPGWEVYHGDAPQPIVGVGIFAHVFQDDITNFNLVPVDDNPTFTQGSYSVYAEARTGDSFALVQRGDVPETAPYLRLRKTNPWVLSINGQPVRSTVDGAIGIPSQTPTIAIFDLSAYAGQNVELSLSVYTNVISAFGSMSFQLDSLEFL